MYLYNLKENKNQLSDDMKKEKILIPDHHDNAICIVGVFFS